MDTARAALHANGDATTNAALEGGVIAFSCAGEVNPSQPLTSGGREMGVILKIVSFEKIQWEQSEIFTFHNLGQWRTLRNASER